MTGTEYMATVNINGKTYSIVIVSNEDGTFSPDVAEVAADGGMGRKIVDAETTDEVYTNERTAMLHAMGAIV